MVVLAIDIFVFVCGRCLGPDVRPVDAPDDVLEAKRKKLIFCPSVSC